MADESQLPEPEATGWRSAAGRLSASFLKSPRPRAPGEGSAASASAMSDDEKRRAIQSLDARERKFGFYGAALAGLIALAITVPYVLDPKKKVSQTVAATKHHACTIKGFTYDKATGKCNGKAAYPLEHWVQEMLLLLAFAVAIYVAVRIGRRGAVGFTALFTGFAFLTYAGVLGIPFIFGGGWLLNRAWRVQRYGSPTATKSNPTGERRAPPPPRAERAPPRAKKSKKPVPTGPVANKRYTPKAPRKKKLPATPPAS